MGGLELAARQRVQSALQSPEEAALRYKQAGQGEAAWMDVIAGRGRFNRVVG